MPVESSLFATNEGAFVSDQAQQDSTGGAGSWNSWSILVYTPWSILPEVCRRGGGGVPPLGGLLGFARIFRGEGGRRSRGVGKIRGSDTSGLY